MGAPYQGYANLGEAIFGRGNRQEAYNRGATEAAQLELLLAKARQEVDQARKRSEYRQTLIQNGVPAEVASILDAAQGSGYNPEQISGYRLGTQRFDLTGEAAGMARSGNVDAMNNLLTVINGSPRVRTNITQGMAFDPYAAPQQQMQTTPVGLADIAATAALGRQRDAAAAESYAGASADQALAGLRSRTDPNIRSGGGSGGGAQTGGSLSADTMAMFSRPNPLDPTGKPQLDPKAYQDFLSWWQSVGGQGNINDAARRWITIRNPVFIDPSNPASMGRSPPAGMPATVADTAQLESDLMRDGASPDAIASIVEAVTKGRDFSVTAPVQQAPRPTEEDALQALADAREAIRRGLITPEEAKRRLRAAGMTRTAERIK